MSGTGDQISSQSPIESREDVRNMATFEKRNLGDVLSIEILRMIFEYLSREAQKTLRLVCQQLNIIALSFAYQKMHLTQELLPRRPNPVTSRIVDHIRMNCREISIGAPLNWYRVIKLLSECRVIQDLRWFYFPGSLFAFPIAMKDSLQYQLPHIRLHLELSCFATSKTFAPESFPPVNLASLYFGDCKPNDQTNLNSLLVSSKQLKFFQLKSDIYFSTEHGNLPAMNMISLGHWPYIQEEVVEIWDFSRLRRLELSSIDVGSFLRSVSAAMFPEITSLELSERKGSSESQLAITAAELAKFLANLRPLTDLSLACSYPHKFVEGIEKHEQSLKHLGLKFCELANPKPHAVDLNHLAKILNCVNLEDLIFILDPPVPRKNDEYETLLPLAKLLAGCKNLREFMGFCIGSHAEQYWNSHSVKMIDDYIRKNKDGLPILDFTFCVEIPHGDNRHAGQYWAYQRYNREEQGDGPSLTYPPLTNTNVVA
ncbi:hypothetical protein G7Y89_g8626 [Cudoniella acicularis]|uniref:F-box domain-containing protein n=1 Tax=Cudoniella acicularis TaxID=354080 RepID=A0A8H4W3D9_9HELO|nr:hypothetical protein G7Y89_g8626 [Cudoniella acicularis]